MSKFYASPSPIIPDHPADPRWPESREERCAKYEDWYRLFWKLRTINRAQKYAREDARRAGRKR